MILLSMIGVALVYASIYILPALPYWKAILSHKTTRKD